MTIFFNASQLHLLINNKKNNLVRPEDAFHTLTVEQNLSVYFKDESDLLLFWYEFTQLLKIIPAAGGIVQFENKFLWMKRRGMWDLPKGKIDPGEIASQAALREVTEETGLSELELGAFIGTTWHVYFHKNQWVLKPTYWYAMKAISIEGLKPQKEEDIEELLWADESMAEQLDTFASIREIWTKK